MGPVSAKRLDIGDAFSDAFAVIRRRFRLLLLADLVLIGAPSAIIIAGSVLTMLSPFFGLVSILGLLAMLGGVVLMYGAVTHAAMQDLRAQPVTLGDMIKVAARKFWPILGLGILAALGIAVGSVLLIVPGVILALAWCVALPVMVIEDRGIIDSFKRSAELTRGKRWAIFLLFLIVGVVTFVFELVLALLTGGAAPKPSTLSQAVSFPFNVVFTLFSIAMYTSLFSQLRGTHSDDVDAVAEVFS